MALIDEKIKRARQRFVVGEVSEEDYNDVMKDFREQKDVLQLQLEKVSHNLSNLEKTIPTVIATASKLKDLWHDSDYETKLKIEKLVYPNGVFWDKEKRNYRTENRNSVFNIMDKYSITYGDEKGTASSETVPLCG